jgi:hypothetical protein
MMRSPAAVLERIDMIGAKTCSLLIRAEALESAARELRTEAAEASHEVTKLKCELGSGIVVARVRRFIRQHLEDARTARGAA